MDYPPLKNSAFTFNVSLTSQSDTDLFQTSPTLAAGDITVSKDGGAFANIATLPTQIGSTGCLPVALTADEMNADRVTIRYHDQSGDEWQDLEATIYTSTVQLSSLALEATLTAIKGAGWSAETLVALDALIDAIKAKTDLLPADPLLNTVPGSYPSGSAGDALGRIGSGQITTVSPVAQDGDVETIQGDDYDNAHGRAIDWTDSSAAWPELTSATIKVVIGGIVELTGSVVTATGSSKKVRVEPTDVQTAAIKVGIHPFQVIATLSDSDVVTLVEGSWNSKKRLTST